MSLYIFIFLLITFLTIKSDDKLIFVMTHFRHGARAPQYYYDQDNYLDYIKEHWDNPGELTGVGQRMHYLLGIRNRLRYIDEKKFLSKKFNPHEILIYSSPFNRTIISVSSQLQGLYPQYISQGENVTEKQKDFAVPQVNIDCEEINEEINNLNYSALPNSMILAPVRMINNNERKITLYDIEPCTYKRDKIKTKHSETLSSLLNITKTFNERYGEKLDKFYGKKEKYDMWFMDNFCDAFISGYTHKRTMEELNKTEIDFEELIDFCFEFQKLNFRDWISGDPEHVLAHLEVSKLMKEFIHYMKERIKADINGEKDIDKKYEDYSRPKMMMISGHDSTISCYEIFLMEALNYNITENYVYPKFAAQIAFEVTTENDNKPGKTYAHYYINYYFNDKQIFKISVEDFLSKVKNHIWSDKKINDFCGFDKNNNDEDEKSYKVLLVVFICFTAFFLFTTVLFMILWRKKYNESRISGNPLISRNTE